MLAICKRSPSETSGVTNSTSTIINASISCVVDQVSELETTRHQSSAKQ